ncbi:notch-regulated ankyrin repeat-containing protein-like [Tubulanus polymorphus]|uniref:notch-regulated ankyrin repeat-containing protein-like n=1 Tax=Tubulanus polymorphus TaxID=672921 RepID=UPI003DA3D591
MNSYSLHQDVFHAAVKTGDSRELQRIMQEYQGKVNVNKYDREGQTALHQCCIEGNLELVKLLLKFGADVRLANIDGWSPLHVAAYGGHKKIADCLINHSASTVV